MTGYPLNATAAQLHFPTDARTSVPSAIAPEDAARAGVYALLGALLRGVPNAALLEQVRALPAAEGRGEFALAWEGVRLAAQQFRLGEVDDEYHQLFIGLGRGELVPYGSWYMTGFLMERPLAVLRDDLQKFGYTRSLTTHEPEDHVAALCEVMLMLIEENAAIEKQRNFFMQHIDSWFEQFFTDMSVAKNAVFYRAVARFGAAFMGIEKRYLQAEV